MELILSNGIKVIYKKGSSKLTSISIGIDAGAALEENLLGLAHMTEHMVYKGTKNRNENKINEELTNLFGFQNAMTNYPYVIYYGSLLENDLDAGLDLFSDIIMNPDFNEEGFKEEKQVVIQELQEWDDELEQFCEDRLFYNSYIENRLKYPIIGREEDLNRITIEDIKRFYKNHYAPENTSIGIVSRLGSDKVVEILEKYFSSWNNPRGELKLMNKEKPKVGIYKDYREGIKNSRVEIIFSLGDLTKRELSAFRVFNEFFGEGVNSILFNDLRTKGGFVYDVLTNISYEKHINLYKITFTTSKEKIISALEIFDKALKRKYNINEDKIQELIKSMKIKKLFKEEQGIYLAKQLSVNSVMNRSFSIIDDIKVEEVMEVKHKILDKYTIEIINPKG